MHKSFLMFFRSETPLLYKAVPSWFIRVELIVQQLLENNKKCYWLATSHALSLTHPLPHTPSPSHSFYSSFSPVLPSLLSLSSLHFLHPPPPPLFSSSSSRVPEFVKERRFHNWLRDARDWAVSRNRYWGTPIPLWVSEDFSEVNESHDCHPTVRVRKTNHKGECYMHIVMNHLSDSAGVMWWSCDGHVTAM